MTILSVTTRAGVSAELVGQAGTTLMEAIRDAGFSDAFAACGGGLSCATCHVYVEDSDGDALGVASEDEDDLLSGSNHRQANSRLSCQIPLTGDLERIRITIAPED